MAEFLTNENTRAPLALSIEGDWGSGKSSFMKQLQLEIKRIKRIEQEKKPTPKFVKFRALMHDKAKRLQVAFALEFLWKIFEQIEHKKKPTPKFVCFNAWRHDKAEALWAAFALEFLRQISGPQTVGEVIPTFMGHGKLSFARFDWKEGLLDALRIGALLVIGGFAIFRRC